MSLESDARRQGQRSFNDPTGGNQMGIKSFSLRRFLKDECGAAMVEYGVALLVVAAIGAGAMSVLGEEVSDNVESACDAFGGSDGCESSN